MNVLRCPDCGQSFVLIGLEDKPRVLELTLFCMSCMLTLQLELPKADETVTKQVGFHHDEGTGQYL